MTGTVRSISAALLAHLENSLSAGALLTDPAQLPAFGRDFWDARGTPGVVVRAQSAEDVVATLRLADEHEVPVVPRAAGTNIGAGYLPTPESIMLDLRLLDRVLQIDAGRLEAVVQPGVLNGSLQAQLAPLGLCFSPDPASAPLSSIGGNIAENAGGPHCLKYGVTVHHVKGVTCVLPGGHVLTLDESDAGPDLLGVLIGSEGTLGIVTEARLRLRRLPPVTRTLLAAFGRAEEAAEAVSAIIAAGVIPAALEFFDRTVAGQLEAFSPGGYPLDAEAILLVDVDGTPEEVARDLPVVEAELRRHAGVVRRADDDAARAAMWRGRLLAGHALAASGYDYYISDVTVPRERIPEMQRAVYVIAERVGLTIGIVGHAGDGNIHPNILYHRDDPSQVAAMKTAAEEIVVASLKLGGTLTGEHGVGSEKRDHMRLHFSPAEIAAMRAVKETFDPHGILNPGILLPDPAPDEPELPLFSGAIKGALSSRMERCAERWEDEAAEQVDTNPQTAIAEQADANQETAIVLDIPNLTVRVGAQVQIGELHQVLAARGFRCAVTGDLERNGERSVGAVIGDSDCRLAVRYSLLGVRVVLPDGQPARFGGSAVKDVAGYDLKRLYIGSGKTFAAIQEATFRVQP